jgi:DNA-binding SARP family transcriptional activator
MLRTLVLALFCERGAFIPIGRLGDVLAAPGMSVPSRTTVRTHMSHLRRAIATASEHEQAQDFLATSTDGASAGYALCLDDVKVDASSFKQRIEAGERALYAGNYALAARESRDALSLWRGRPLYEAAERPFAFAEIQRLEDLFRQATIAQVAADVGAKDHRSVIADLEQMVRWWPDVVDLRVLHIVALYRSSNHARAAQACQSAIQAAQGLGLSQRRLDALQRDILTEALPAAGLPHTSWES